MNIGITGHQNIGGKKLINWVRRELHQEIIQNKEIKIARSSLAIGADQIFAQVVLEMNINLISVIPSEGYEKTFATKERTEYFRLKSLCSSTEFLNFPSPAQEAFLAAGIHIADHSDLIFAVWDGLPAKGLGGTGDIVKYALSLGKHVIHLQTITKNKQVYNG